MCNKVRGEKKYKNCNLGGGGGGGVSKFNVITLISIFRKNKSSPCQNGQKHNMRVKYKLKTPNLKLLIYFSIVIRDIFNMLKSL